MKIENVFEKLVSFRIFQNCTTLFEIQLFFFSKILYTFYQRVVLGVIDSVLYRESKCKAIHWHDNRTRQKKKLLLLYTCILYSYNVTALIVLVLDLGWSVGWVSFSYPDELEGSVLMEVFGTVSRNCLTVRRLPPATGIELEKIWHRWLKIGQRVAFYAAYM